MNKTFDKCGKWFKSIPWYGIVIGLLLTLGLQTLLYNIGCHWIPHKSGIWSGTDPQIHEIDKHFPLVPQFFALFYWGWKLIFPIGVILASAKITLGSNKEDWINLMISWTIAIVIGGMVLIFFPTFVDRNNAAGVPGGNIFEYVKDKTGFGWWIYKHHILDTKVIKEFGCLPSYHCLQIIFCHLAVMGKKDRHIAHRLGWLSISIIICLSTLFTKQHYVIDVVAAIALAYVTFFVTKMFNPGKALLNKWPNFLIIKQINWSHEKIHTKQTTIKSQIKD